MKKVMDKSCFCSTYDYVLYGFQISGVMTKSSSVVNPTTNFQTDMGIWEYTCMWHQHLVQGTVTCYHHYITNTTHNLNMPARKFLFQ